MLEMVPGYIETGPIFQRLAGVVVGPLSEYSYSLPAFAKVKVILAPLKISGNRCLVKESDFAPRYVR